MLGPAHAQKFVAGQTTVMASSVILIKDLPAEKNQSSFGGLRTSSKPTNAPKGELLVSRDKLVERKGRGKPHNYQLARDNTVSLRAEPDDIAPLNKREFALLEAVKSPHTRYSIFLSSEKLDWGLSLRKGREVYVVVNPEAPQSAWVRSKAVVRWFGELGGDQRGTQFGVEITEKSFHGQGTTDGTFQGKRYFTCQDGCGLFAALDTLFSEDPGKSLRTEDKGTKTLEEEGLFDNLKHELEQVEEKIKLRHEAQKQQMEQLLAQSQQKEQDLRIQLMQSQQAEDSLKTQLAQATKAMEDLQERLAQTEKRLQESVQSEYDLRRQVVFVTQLNEEKAHLQQQMEKQKSSQELEFWNVSRTDIHIVSEIGRGGWGTIFKGTFQGRAVAVKQLHRRILSRDNTQRLRREVRMMAQVRHPNLLLFIAAVFDDEVERLRSPPLIVMELLNTDLRSAYERGLVDAQSKLSIFKDVAFALNYLHNCREPIIHRDLSAPNVLLEALANNRWKAKISDFGSANLAKVAQTAAEGAIIYSAPETLPDELRGPNAPKIPQTPKIDVYSYGVLLCEVITCKLPDKFKQLKAEVQQSWPFMHSLISSCTNYYPDDRPTIDRILNDLQSSLVTHLSASMPGHHGRHHPAHHDGHQQLQSSQLNPGPTTGHTHNPNRSQPVRQRSVQQENQYETIDEVTGRGLQEYNPQANIPTHCGGHQQPPQQNLQYGQHAPRHQEHQGYGGQPTPQHFNGSGQAGHFQQSASSPHQSPQLETQHSNVPTVYLGPDPALALGIGSMVQVFGCYGVVRWIGELAEVQGIIAGVELEEGMNGCTDGSRNGVQYFTCKSGRGFFCPLSSLRPDERFTSPGETPVNNCTQQQTNEDVKRTLMMDVDEDARCRLLMGEYKLENKDKAIMVIELMKELEIQGCEGYPLQYYIDAARNYKTLEEAKEKFIKPCPICGEVYPIHEMIMMPGCTDSLCKDCFKGHFSVVIKEQGVKYFNCPLCSKPDLTNRDQTGELYKYLELLTGLLKEYIDADVYILYENKLRDFTLSKLKGFCWCANDKCRSGFINERHWEDVFKIQCPNCKEHMCFQCKRPWEEQHRGISCENFAQWKQDNDPEAQQQGLAAHLKVNGIECPACHVCYDLARGGSMHFRCTQCPNEFCSGCGQSFENGRKCGQFESCAGKGLHAHHPRDCLFYLRDFDVEELQKFLKDNKVDFDTEPTKKQLEAAAERMRAEKEEMGEEEAAEEGKKDEGEEVVELKCVVLLQKELADGLVDEECGKNVQKGHAGLCMTHYKEYLVSKINQAKLDPVTMYETVKIMVMLVREEMEIPEKEEDEDYRKRLIEHVQANLPLQRLQGEPRPQPRWIGECIYMY